MQIFRHEKQLQNNVLPFEHPKAMTLRLQCFRFQSHPAKRQILYHHADLPKTQNNSTQYTNGKLYMIITGALMPKRLIFAGL